VERKELKKNLGQI